jgi:hypothetical protein
VWWNIRNLKRTLLLRYKMCSFTSYSNNAFDDHVCESLSSFGTKLPKLNFKIAVRPSGRSWMFASSWTVACKPVCIRRLKFLIKCLYALQCKCCLLAKICTFFSSNFHRVLSFQCKTTGNRDVRVRGSGSSGSPPWPVRKLAERATLCTCWRGLGSGGRRRNILSHKFLSPEVALVM